MSVISLSGLSGGLLFLWCFLLFPWFTAIAFTAARISLPKRKGLLLPALGLLIVAFCFLLSARDITGRQFFAAAYLRRYVPAWVIFTLLLLLTCYLGILHSVLLRRQETVTPRTIKDAVDSLPVGLAFYEENGLVRLSNTRINEFAAALLGHTLGNGKEFWAAVEKRAGRSMQGAPSGAFLLSLQDGTTYVIKRETVRVTGLKLWEITVYDITQEYMLNLELEQKRAITSEMNRRLKALSGRITRLSVEKEILDSKIRMHDRWAEGLLRARQYLSSQSCTTKAEVLSSWKRSISQLAASEDTPENFADRYDELLESAKLLGIRIDVNGSVPENKRFAPVILQAMTTCLSNVASHTDGSVLFVDIQQSPGSVLVLFRDNGSLPVAEIRETGGLRNLRRSVEQLGGRMRVDHSPCFLLEIELGGESDDL